MKRKINLLILTIIIVTFCGSSISEAKSKINKTNLTLKIGKSYQLKIKGTKNKVKWSSSNKKIVSVTKKGKIKAKKLGKAKIYAKIKKRKLVCSVVVVKKRNTKSKNVDTNLATKKTSNTVTPSPIVTPDTTSSPTSSATPGTLTNPTIVPTVTAEPQYTDGPKLEQTYHGKIGFSTNDWSLYDPEDSTGCIKNISNGFFCKDSLGNYIADEPYKVNCEEVTIDHAGTYSFKLNGINNILQKAIDFNALYVQTDIFANKNIICKNLELNIDGTIIKKADYDKIEKDSMEDYRINVKNIWGGDPFFKSEESITIPKESIEIKCYLDPGEDRGRSKENLMQSNSTLQKYIFDFCHNELTDYPKLNTDKEGIVLEDNDNLYVISCYEDEEEVYYEQYDKNSYKLKSRMQLSCDTFRGYICYGDFESLYNIANITRNTVLQFKDDNDTDIGPALNTEANQEFQRSLSAWNQLLQERLHMSLKDLGFLSYE